MPSPVLSLCYPTFSRSALLDQSLRAALSQIAPSMAGRVEVLVLDNASPDDTPAVVARAEADFPHVGLRSIRRPQNIGPDANFVQAIQEARGEFVYLLSDDDVLLPGAVERLLSLIETYPDFDAFCLNVNSFKDDLDHVTSSLFKNPDDLVLTTCDEAFAFLKLHLAFISCMAFRRANVADKDYSDKLETLLIQGFFFTDVLSPSQGLYVTKQCYLSQRREHAVGYNFFKVFVTNFDGVMQYAQQAGYSSWAIREVRNAVLIFIRHFVQIFKTDGSYGQLCPNYPDAIRRLLKTYGLHPQVLFRIIPIILMPRPVYLMMLPLMKFYSHQKRRKLGSDAMELPT